MKTAYQRKSETTLMIYIVLFGAIQVCLLGAYFVTHNIMLLGGMIAVQAVGVGYWQDRNWIALAQAVTGQVVDYRQEEYSTGRGGSQTIDVFGITYTLHTTQHSYEYDLPRFSKKPVVGAPIDLLYNPNNLDDVRPSQDRWITARLMIMMTAIFLLIVPICIAIS
ncbi:MAG: DUF3592 domain-containing protein [Rudanella sp.]|nr:DUF3592 domain-containing protein [Rudanella sp.]